jgi:hypothetical protein
LPQFYGPAQDSGQLFLVQGSNLVVIGGQGGNAAEVQRSLRANVAAALAQTPALRIVDAQLSGGGPGNTFQAIVLCTKADERDPAYPSLNAILFQVVEASAQREVSAQLAIVGSRFAVAWAQAIGGGGSPFMALLASST